MRFLAEIDLIWFSKCFLTIIAVVCHFVEYDFILISMIHRIAATFLLQYCIWDGNFGQQLATFSNAMNH